MRKLFSLLALATVIMMLSAGLGLYWLSNNEATASKQDAATAEAKSIAFGVAAQINLLDKTLDKMAQDPEVLNAIITGNSGLLRVTAEKLEKYIPDILKIRLLLPDTNEIDEQSKPRMGFADLELVKGTLKGNQFPGIQGDKGIDRHLAIARGITQNGKVIGVILASLDENIILGGLRLAPVKNGYYELKQGQLVLGAIGAKDTTENLDSNQVNIANTDWTIHYRHDDAIDVVKLGLVAGLIIVPLSITLLVIFIAHQRLSNTLTQDLESLMKAFKDMMTGTAHSHYPVDLAEMNAAVSNLIQFKRVIDYGDRETSMSHNTSSFNSASSDIIVSDDDEFDLDDLFDDINDFKL
ncbi:MAG: hypothetical protein PHU14_02770 [Methylovulum sp.]|nr:hypothetical protein [Methylovulum sp.]